MLPVKNLTPKIVVQARERLSTKYDNSCNNVFRDFAFYILLSGHVINWIAYELRLKLSIMTLPFIWRTLCGVGFYLVTEALRYLVHNGRYTQQ